MRLSRYLSASALSVGALLCLLPQSPASAASRGERDVGVRSAMSRIPSDVPVGVRIGLARVVKAGGAGGDGGGRQPPPALVFADSAGLPFYALEAGKECTATCLEKWKPALAESGAKPAGNLDLVNLPSGQKQWTLRGRPLFTLIGAKSLSDPLVLIPHRVLRPGGISGVEAVDAGPEGMKLARVEPQSWIESPKLIGVAEYRLAGQVLATGVSGNNAMGRPLYLFSGTPEQEKALPAVFQPLYAAGLSLPVGDFTIRTRSDAMPQWVYRGSPLYTCDCDISTGDLNGDGAAPGIAPAVVVRYYVPPQVIVKRDPLSIGRLVEARTGKTLYFRDRMEDDYQPDNTRPLLGTVDALVAAMVGIKHCDAVCEKEWVPFLAPNNAKPVGYWSIYERPDGKRQWAYKNAAVYTHANEPAGALDGNENYEVAFDDGIGGQAWPIEFGIGLSWRALTP